MRRPPRLCLRGAVAGHRARGESAPYPHSGSVRRVGAARLGIGISAETTPHTDSGGADARRQRPIPNAAGLLRTRNLALSGRREKPPVIPPALMFSQSPLRTLSNARSPLPLPLTPRP